MPQDMRRDMLVETRRLDGGGKTLAHRTHRLAVPLDNGMRRDAEPMPSPQMCKQPIRQAHRRLAFLRLAAPWARR